MQVSCFCDSSHNVLNNVVKNKQQQKNSKTISVTLQKEAIRVSEAKNCSLLTANKLVTSTTRPSSNNQQNNKAVIYG